MSRSISHNLASAHYQRETATRNFL